MFKVAKSYLAVVQIAQLFNDPFLKNESLAQLLAVVLNGHFALLLRHRLIPLQWTGPGAAAAGLKEHPTRRRGQLRGRLGACGGHCGCDEDDNDDARGKGDGFEHLLFKAHRDYLKDSRRVGGGWQANVRVRVSARSRRYW